MQVKLKRMQDKIDFLEKKNMRLKEQNNNGNQTLTESNPQHQNRESKETRDDWDQGKWGKGGWWVDDPGKDWKAEDVTTYGGDERVNDNGKWGQKFRKDETVDGGTRLWWGGRFDRRNEMVIKGF
jgi:hypothetical protein